MGGHMEPEGLDPLDPAQGRIPLDAVFAGRTGDEPFSAFGVRRHVLDEGEMMG